MISGTAAVYAAASATPFSIAVQPSSQSIGSGGAASYVVSVAPSGSFGGNVTLSVTGLPKGTAASWTPGSTKSSGTGTVTIPANATTAQNVTLTVGGGQPSSGTYSMTVTGSSTGGSATSNSFTLTVAGQNAADFTLSPSPNTISPHAGPGDPATTIAIGRTNWSGAVTLGPVTGLPSGVSATFTSGASTGASISTTASSATLTVAVPISTTPGTYTLVVPGSAVLSGKTATTNYAALTLTVPQAAPFTISGGSSSLLKIGAPQPLNLQITNPYGTPLTVSHIQVTIGSVSQAVGASGTCNQTSGTNSPNFLITPLSSSYSVTVPANSSATLSSLGSGAMPYVTWIDQKWSQNGCVGARLNFSYSANGSY